MSTLMNIKNKIIKSFFIVLLIIPLNSCGIWDPGDARKIDPNVDKRAEKNIQEGKGFRLGKALGDRGGGNFQFASSNEMWRATLGLLSFTPLTNVDYSGGIIITEWFSNKNSDLPKGNVRICFNRSVPILFRFVWPIFRYIQISCLLISQCG